MKEFVNWLGVNEKIAKVVVWMLIFMICLIVINTCLESIGLPHYSITYDNVKKIEANKIVSIISKCIMCMLNFYVTILLVFKLKESKKIIKYALLYTMLNWIIFEVFGYVITQLFIIIYMIFFCYMYSKKNKKYILYGILAMFINLIVQAIAYQYKAKLIDLSELNSITQVILSIDYFIIMAIIILVKEIYLKKRGVING